MPSTLLTFRCRVDSGNLRYASLPQHSSRAGRTNTACYIYVYVRARMYAMRVRERSTEE